MKTNISLPKDDKCGFCDQKCPDNIYDCEILSEAINKKQCVYVWYWTKKE